MKPIDLSQFDGITPRPWLYDGLRRESDHTPAHFVIHGPDGRAEIAQVFYHPSDDEQAANARAIAAVPDLIAEIKALKEALARVANAGLGEVSSDLRAAACNALGKERP